MSSWTSAALATGPSDPPAPLEHEACAADVGLLQLGFKVGGLVPAVVDGDALCPSQLAGAAVLCAMGVSMALIMIVIMLPLARWAASPQGEGPAGGLLGESGGGHGKAACDCKEDRQAPWSVWLSNCTGRFLLSVNFTIVLPSSGGAMAHAGGATSLSGITIGAFAVGAVLATPVGYYISRTSYRGALVFMGAAMVVGNGIYAATSFAHGSAAVCSMILARVLCGFQAGAQVIFINSAQKTSSGAGLARLTAKANFSATLGLVIGPAIAALASRATPGLPPAVAPSVLMAAVGLAFGGVSAACFPAQKDLPLRGEEMPPEARDDVGKAVWVRKCWLCLAVQVFINLCRFCQRVAWEAGFLTVMTRVYGLSSVKSSLLVGVPALVSLPLASQGARLHALGVGGAMHLLELTELVGIILMFGWPLPSDNAQVALFVVGSCLFYVGNWLTVVPLQTLRSGFTHESHWALSTEAASGAASLACFAGQFYGPVLARGVLSVCASRNMLAACTLVLWLGSFVSLEPARTVLLKPSSSAGDTKATAKA